MTNISEIPFISVSYNSPDLINKLVKSIRTYYDNKIYIIDGSDAEHKKEIQEALSREANVEFISFDFNIHHGPGMAWAINNIPHNGQVLFIDSDMEIIKAGLLEAMQDLLSEGLYGVGRINKVNHAGFDQSDDTTQPTISYLHPALMLCNISVMREWPMPVKHGAPMIETMLALDKSENSKLIKHIDWVDQDIVGSSNPNYVLHAGRGTVLRTGGYHLEEWMNSLNESNLSKMEHIEMNNYQFTNAWFAGAAKANWDLLIPQINPTKLLEIGSYEGASACYLIDTLATKNNIEIHCIDTWSGGIEHQEGGTAQTDMGAVETRFRSNVDIAIANKPHRVTLEIHKGFSSIELAKLISEGKSNYFDLIYIDGSHQAPDVLMDAVLSFKLLRVGGIMIFDDYLWAEHTVTTRNILECPKPAIDSFMNIFFRKMSIISAPLYQIYAQKVSD